MLRCPGCGQRLTHPAPPRCPLCHLDFGDARVTDVDTTPYARAYAQAEMGWRGMLNWVWYATTERLKHLALMRCSAASRRFRWINVSIAAGMLGVFLVARVGWQRTHAPAVAETATEVRPAGDAWRRVAALPRPLPADLPPDRAVDLWWNPAQFGLALAVGVPSAYLMLLSLLGLQSGMITLAHARAYRRDGRMTAAVHYGTAWFVPMGVSTALLLLLPATYVTDLHGVSWSPPSEYVELAAAVFATFGVVLWWIWFIRLGATAPPRTRGRVIATMVAGLPLLLIAALLGWWYGTQALIDLLAEKLRLRF